MSFFACVFLLFEILQASSKPPQSYLFLNVLLTLFSSSDSLSTALSALYAKMVVILGIALPITEILSNRISASVYQGFYVYLYVVSISFVVFIYVSQLRRKAVFTIIKNYRKFARKKLLNDD